MDRVLKKFDAFGKTFGNGETYDFSECRNYEKLIRLRYIEKMETVETNLPIDGAIKSPSKGIKKR